MKYLYSYLNHNLGTIYCNRVLKYYLTVCCYKVYLNVYRTFKENLNQMSTNTNALEELAEGNLQGG